MLFAIICNDKPDSLDIRMATRSDHLAYLDSLGNAVKIAGPFLDGEEKPCGSLVVIEAADRQQATDIAANDPYMKAELFSKVEIRTWNWVIGKPEA